ncbi:hypothetical protein [Rhodanobacter sp. C01]|uniref:hypothetical protein n=1 Tax=Rhodanobacter sp. C01 TaxID=1945856 RepID=UPI000985E24C|nr:hypothetical protein [Rhodanobacter sp. C01]OOG47024.1 hypothetical protein B0E50_13905 [Rhodanobacter sp. C01]
MNLSFNAAQRDYPHTWSEIKAQVAEIKHASDADIIPLDVHIIEVNGVKMLEVVCLTDLVMDDTEQPASGMRIRAPINEVPASQRIH